MSESRGTTQAEAEAESDTIVDAIETVTVTASERATVCALIMYAYYTSRKHLTNNCI